MTTNLRNRSWARALGSVFFSTSISFALAACGGGDSDDVLTDTEDGPAQPAGRGNAENDGAGQQGPDTADDDADADEGNPDVTGIDRTEDDEENETAGDDAEAAQTPAAPVSAEVPDTDHCALVADWDPEWVQFEEEVLELVNEFRSQPADCGVEGQFEAAPPLAMDSTLRCSARLHSLDMFEREYFSHDNPDGLDPFQRMQEAGFEGQRMGENIAQGQPTPEVVMQDWMESDGHCANIMQPQYTLIGIGFEAGTQQVFGGASNYWTQNFGTPFARRPSR